MGFGETLKKHPFMVSVVVTLLVVVCGVVIYSQVRTPRQPDASLASKVFYSDDDGKTWFLDDFSKGSPFDHGGKQACRAIVFRCPNGRPFIAFLTKYSQQQIDHDREEVSHAPAGTPSGLFGSPMRLLKKPGELNWGSIPTVSQTGYPEVRCPDGNATASLVSAADPDSGASK